MYKINLWNEKIPFHNLLKMYVEVHACSYNLTFWQVALMRLLPFYKLFIHGNLLVQVEKFHEIILL